MMKLSREQKHILFLFGCCWEQAVAAASGKPFSFVLSKKAFMDIAWTSNIVEKKERALYKNLELLEKRKLLVYHHSMLSLSERGKKAFLEIKKDLEPFVQILKSVNADLIMSSGKVRATLRMDDVY